MPGPKNLSATQVAEISDLSKAVHSKKEIYMNLPFLFDAIIFFDGHDKFESRSEQQTLTK